MTLEQLTKRNEKFQQQAAQLVELLPGTNILPFVSSMVRCSKKIDKILHKVVFAKGEMSFFNQLDLLEEEIDELVFMMDRLEEANRKKNVLPITQVIKSGYELVSLYSKCCDQVIEQKMKNHDEFK